MNNLTKMMKDFEEEGSMTVKEYLNGSSELAELVDKVKVDIIVNV